MIWLVHFILDIDNQRADHENSGDAFDDTWDDDIQRAEQENSGDGFTSSFDDDEMMQQLRAPNQFDAVEFNPIDNVFEFSFWKTTSFAITATFFRSIFINIGLIYHMPDHFL